MDGVGIYQTAENLGVNGHSVEYINMGSLKKYFMNRRGGRTYKSAPTGAPTKHNRKTQGNRPGKL